jgi:hypothetical protein
LKIKSSWFGGPAWAACVARAAWNRPGTTGPRNQISGVPAQRQTQRSERRLVWATSAVEGGRGGCWMRRWRSPASEVSRSC